MADFQKCLSFVLPHEAGTPPSYEVTNDNKGQVIAGVNSLAFPEDFAAIAALPIGQRPAAVQSFYERRFWNQYLAQIISNAIAAYILDADVNEGQCIGIDILQDAVDACGGSVVVDGHIGPRTVLAANQIAVATLLLAARSAREAAYRKIGGPNLPAWLARAALLPNLD